MPTDTCHNLLIEVCTQAGRLDEALDLVKRLARQRGAMQQQTLNSLTRALSASHVDRALRLLSLMSTLGLRVTRSDPGSPSDAHPQQHLGPTVLHYHAVFITHGAWHHVHFGNLNRNCSTLPIYVHAGGLRGCEADLSLLLTLTLTCRETCVTLIRACAKASRSDVAEAMYWDLRRQKLEVTRAAGSALIVSLCAADATGRAQTVYDDMTMVAAGDKSSPVRT